VELLEARVRRLCQDAGLAFSPIVPLAGDVGQRRYFRMSPPSGSAIVVAYPEGTEEACRRWNRVRAALAPAIRVPRVLAEEPGGGMQILEDFGDRPLSSFWEGSADGRRRRHQRAARIAAAIAATPDPGVNPPFTAAFFFSEMEKSREAFFDAFAGDPLSAAERSVHDEFAAGLASEIASHPPAFVHRDFHVDNLFAAEDQIAVIDFQDARTGPDAYDVASLIGERAALVHPDPAASEAAVAAFSAAYGPKPGFADRLARVGLQRGWKAAGTFARVCHEGREREYRRFLAPQIAAVERGLRKSGVEAEFIKILGQRSAKLFRKEETPC